MQEKGKSHTGGPRKQAYRNPARGTLVDGMLQRKSGLDFETPQTES